MNKSGQRGGRFRSYADVCIHSRITTAVVTQGSIHSIFNTSAPCQAIYSIKHTWQAHSSSNLGLYVAVKIHSIAGPHLWNDVSMDANQSYTVLVLHFLQNTYSYF